METTTLLLEAIARSGVSSPALLDALARGERHFRDHAPTAEQVDHWVQDVLHREAPHLWPPVPTRTPAPVADVEQRFGMSPAQWARLSAEERLSRSRAIRAPTGRQRPQRLELTSAQVAELAAMPAEQRLSAYRQLQAQQGRG